MHLADFGLKFDSAVLMTRVRICLVCMVSLCLLSQMLRCNTMSVFMCLSLSSGFLTHVENLKAA